MLCFLDNVIYIFTVKSIPLWLGLMVHVNNSGVGVLTINTNMQLVIEIPT